jgi:chromosome segregation ATPase
VSDPSIIDPNAPSSGWKTPVVAGAIIAVLAANVYMYLQLDKMRSDMAKFRETMLTEVTNLRETSSVTTQTNRKHLDTLKDELEQARRQANMAASGAQAAATKRAEQLAKQLEDEQQKESQRVTSELSAVKQSATQADAKIGAVSGDVSAVKGEVASTKAELEKTINNLNKVTGDLGVQSGYIATNGKELAALKALGERNYVEFNLGKTKAPQRVGDITLLLKKTDPKKNRYTVEVQADDKITEKRDKSINEPVQFYVQKAKQPYELVVNSVSKDKIVGYLSSPKNQVARN